MSQQMARLLAETGKAVSKIYEIMHDMARKHPRDFGVTIRHLMKVLQGCVMDDDSSGSGSGGGGHSLSQDSRVSMVKKWSAQHHDSLVPGGTRTPRQVVTLLLRGLLIPAKEQSRVLAESYDDLVGAERSLDSTDDHAEQMRLQLLYVGALETSLQLYVVV